MEKISLSQREIGGRGVLAWVSVGTVGLLMVLFIMVSVRHSVADWYYMRQFKRLVICPGSGISRRRDGEIIETWSLFTQEGITQSLKPYVKRALVLDGWDGEKRYLYARARWHQYRELLTAQKRKAEGLTEEGLEERDRLRLLAMETERTPDGVPREELPQRTVSLLRRAIHRDPMNRCYRMTLADVIETQDKTGTLARAIDQSRRKYPVHTAYGQIRLAEFLAGSPGSDQDVQRHYREALGLLSTDNSVQFITYARTSTGAIAPMTVGEETGNVRTVRKTERVVDYLADRMVKGMSGPGGIGNYDKWASIIPDYAESHWLVAEHLSRSMMDSQANKEYEKVVEIARRKLDRRQKRSSLGLFFEIMCPLTRPDIESASVLKATEIGLAGQALEKLKRPDEALRMFRKQIELTPRDIDPRLAANRLLIDIVNKTIKRLLDVVSKVKELEGQRDRGEKVEKMERRKKDELMEALEKVDPIGEELNENVAEVLKAKPYTNEALRQRREFSEADQELGRTLALPDVKRALRMLDEFSEDK